MEANETPQHSPGPYARRQTEAASWVSSLKLETPEGTSLGACLETDVKGPKDMGKSLLDTLPANTWV